MPVDTHSRGNFFWKPNFITLDGSHRVGTIVRRKIRARLMITASSNASKGLLRTSACNLLIKINDAGANSAGKLFVLVLIVT